MRVMKMIDQTNFAAAQIQRLCAGRGLRLLLTQECNYRCPFCHREGTGERHGHSRSAEQWLKHIIRPALSLGMRKITFTGGEPTLCTDLLVSILADVAQCPEAQRPAIKVVTNGWLIEPRLVAALRDYPTSRRVHVSYHAADPFLYAELTGIAPAEEHMRRVEANIRLLREANVPVTLNVVVIKNKNDTRESFEDLMRKADQLSVRAIQFIPVEGVIDHAGVQRQYVAPQEIEKQLMFCPHIRKLNEEGRKTRFASQRYPSLEISLTRCVCHLGCARCFEYRDIIVDADHRHHPCKLLDDSVPIHTADDFLRAIKEGSAVVKRQIQKYGAGSPALGHGSDDVALRKLKIMDAIVNDLEQRLERAEQARRDAQNDANAHLGRQQSRYDTFKEEAQYLAAAHEKRIAELSQSLAACRQLRAQLLHSRKASKTTDSLRMPIQAGSLVTLCLQTTDGAWSDPFQLFLAPAGAGEEVKEDAAGSMVRIVACDAPFGRVLLGRAQGDEVEVPDLAQPGRSLRAYVIEVQ